MGATQPLSGSTTLMGLSQQQQSLAAPYWLSEDDQGATGFHQSVKALGGSFAIMGMNSEERQGFSASYQRDFGNSYTSTLEVGQVSGEDGLLDTDASGALSLGDNANTQFIGFRGEADLGDVTLFHSAYLGRSEIDAASGIISSMDAVTTSNWMVGGLMEKGRHRFGLTVSQPLKVESADASLSFINGYQRGVGYTTQTVDVDLAPSGRQINSELAYSTSTKHIDNIKASFLRMDQPGHDKEAKADHAVMFTIGTTF